MLEQWVEDDIDAPKRHVGRPAKKKKKPGRKGFLPLSVIMARSEERVRADSRLPQGHCDYCGHNFEADLVRPVQDTPFKQKMACKMCSKAFNKPWITN